MFTPTREQDELIRSSSDGRDKVVIARAGTGKTSTLVRVAEVDPTPGLYVVYNAAARKDAQKRFPGHVRPVTGHSLAFRPMIVEHQGYSDKFKAGRDGRRIPIWDITNAAGMMSVHGVQANKMSALVLRTLAGFQNSADLKISEQHVDDQSMPARFRKPENEQKRMDLKMEVTKGARRIWDRMANSDDPFPILHDTYLKLFQMSDPVLRTDRILLDEWQDANPVINAIVERQNHAQKIYVGDNYQAIYSWRGAVNALQEKRDAGLDLFHLSQSFRFGNQIAGLANILLEARGEDVLMRGAGPQAMKFNPDGPKAVIARNNMTLFEHAVEALEQKKEFALVGGADDLVKLLESGLALYRGELGLVKDQDIKVYDSWSELKEITEIIGDQSMQRLVNVIEKYKGEALKFIDGLVKAGSVDDKAADLVLTTAHRSKGREWAQTELCDDLELGETLMKKLNDGAQLSTTDGEAFNLLYVAATRCQIGMKLAPPLREEFKNIRAINIENRESEQASTTPGMGVA